VDPQPKSLRLAGAITLWLGAFLLYGLSWWGLGWGTCSGGRVVERLPDGTPKRVVGPFECSPPSPGWLTVRWVAYAVAIAALIMTAAYLARAYRTRPLR
jgi:hypothetical protein